MKKSLATMTAALLLTVATAASAVSESDIEKCEQYGGLAESAMQANQMGIPMSNILRQVGNSEFSQTIVVSAYRMNPLIGDEAQEEQRKRFNNYMQSQCINILMRADAGE